MRTKLFRAALCAVIGASTCVASPQDVPTPPGGPVLPFVPPIDRIPAQRPGGYALPPEVIFQVEELAPTDLESSLTKYGLKLISCIPSLRSCLYSYDTAHHDSKARRICTTPTQATEALRENLYACTEPSKKEAPRKEFTIMTNNISRGVRAMTTGVLSSHPGEKVISVTEDPYVDKYQPELVDMGAREVWKKIDVEDSPIVTAVIDSGVDRAHPEFVGQLQGGIDLPSCIGGKPCDGSPYDDDHGTNIAGTIAADKNGKGIIGVAWNTKILPIKAFESGLISDFVAANAIIYAAGTGTGRAKVINASFAGTDPMPLTLAAINQVSTLALVVVPSGNGSRDIVNSCKVYPACYKNPNGTRISNMLVVMSHARDYAHAGTDYTHDDVSNWGKGVVEIAAPGTTFTTKICKPGFFCYDAPFSSSSTATSFTSGAAALVLSSSKYRGLSPTQVKQHILDNALNTPSLSDKLQPPLRLDLTHLLD